MGVLGERQPDRIQNAISFNAETGDFTVSLYRPPNAHEQSQGQSSPIQESITVSQEDIRRNISKEGGGTVDNNRERNGPLWPTVIEAGFAELYGRDSQGKVNLNQGYNIIGDATRGGSLSDGTYALTGESGRSLQIQVAGGPRMDPTGPDHIARSEPPPFKAPSQGAKLGLDAVYAEVEQALAAGRPVSMATQGSNVTDGLEKSHAYMVVGVSRDPQSNEALLTLRNPYGNNQRAGEGNQNIGAGWNANNPEITVSLNTLVREGSFAEFNIGPAARVQTQQQGVRESATPGQPPPASPAPLLNDPAHPNHAMFSTLLNAVHARDDQLGRPHDQSSVQLAGALTEQALARGLTTIGAAKFTDDGTKVGMTNTTDMEAPWAKTAVGNVGELVNRPLTQSSEGATTLSQQMQQTQAQTQTQTPPTQDDPAPKGPRLP